MKIFEYDPKTGKRGAFIKNVERSSWADCSVEHEISQGNLLDLGWVTGNFGENAEVIMHVDSGVMDSNGKDTSYLCDQWICFCTGEWKIGTGTKWVWAILPSIQDLELAKIIK